MAGGTAALALHPKALRQIGELGFFGMNSGSVYEPLMWEVRFFEGNGKGIEALAKPMRLPPKFPHMGFCIYPNKMLSHFILPESLIL